MDDEIRAWNMAIDVLVSARAGPTPVANYGLDCIFGKVLLVATRRIRLEEGIHGGLDGQYEYWRLKMDTRTNTLGRRNLGLAERSFSLLHTHSSLSWLLSLCFVTFHHIEFIIKLTTPCFRTCSCSKIRNVRSLLLVRIYLLQPYGTSETASLRLQSSSRSL